MSVTALSERYKRILGQVLTGLPLLHMLTARQRVNPSDDRWRQRYTDLPPNVDDPEMEAWGSSVGQLKVEGLAIFAFAQIVLAVLVVSPYLNEFPRAQWGLLWLPALLAVGATLTLAVLRISLSFASICNVITLFAASALGIAAFGPGLFYWSFAVPVAATRVLLGMRWACALAGIATLMLASRWPSPEAWTMGMVLAGIAATWAALATTWMGVRPFEEALAWAISSYHEARRRAEESEQHRGELALTVKSLNEAYERLEHLAEELDRARLEAEQARALKGRFAAYISHELRTPLNLIVGFSEMMVRTPHTYGDQVLPAAYRGDVEAIYHSARHLSNLIDDILDLSQIDAHRMALDQDDVALPDIIEEAAAMVETAYAEKGLRLATDVADDLPPLYVDRTRIRQVLINLLSNALRFTSEGGVTIKAAPADGEVIVSVVDTGQGIPEDRLPALFHDFYQVQPSGAQAKGSGLGLAVAKRFVELHGGWMRADSTPGEGSRFAFGLPISRSYTPLVVSEDPRVRQRFSASTSSLPVVAVAGDEPWLVQTLQRYLDDYRVVPAKDGSVDGHRPWRDAVALLVPVHDDASAWRRLEQVSGGVNMPVICCSLHGNREMIDRLGVADYVHKPVTRDRLASVLAARKLGKGAHTVLVVDDDQNVVRLLARMIASISRQYRVAKAYDGASALDMMRRKRPDLVLLDLLMPEMDGYAVLRAMRQDESLRDVPVVVVTAMGMEEDEMVVARMFGITRPSGFPAGEMILCVKAVLDNLTLPVPNAEQIRLEARHPA